MPVLRKDILNDHIYGRIMPGHNGQNQQNGHNALMAILVWIYMAINMVNIGVFKNVDNLRKRIGKNHMG